MDLNKYYGVFHVISILWLIAVTIGLISLSVRLDGLISIHQLSQNNEHSTTVLLDTLTMDLANENDENILPSDPVHHRQLPLYNIKNENDEDVRVNDSKEKGFDDEEEKHHEKGGKDASAQSSYHRGKPSANNFNPDLIAFSDELYNKKYKESQSSFHREFGATIDAKDRGKRKKFEEIASDNTDFQRRKKQRTNIMEKIPWLAEKTLRYKKTSHEYRGNQEHLEMIHKDGIYKEKLNNGVMDERDETKYDLENRRMEINTIEANPYHTSCVLTRAELIFEDPCDNLYNDDSCYYWASIGFCTNASTIPGYDITYEDDMLYWCEKSCGACGIPTLEDQIHKETGNIVSSFNLSLDFYTGNNAKDISWVLFSRNSDDPIFSSNETHTTSQLVDFEQHIIEYNCIVTKKGTHELTDDTKATSCYDFEVHDSLGDGLCCSDYNFFSIDIHTNNSSSHISDNFESGSLRKTSFCMDYDDNKIRSKNHFISEESSSHFIYHFPEWQCKYGICLCDSKPSLSETFSNIEDPLYHIKVHILVEIAMLSDSDKLRDVESAQYKAACWTLNDDPYDYDLSGVLVHTKMMQRYVLAVFYFATSLWGRDDEFLSSRSECDWGKSKCNTVGDLIRIDLNFGDSGGIIVEELIQLRMLEELDFDGIRGTIPSFLGNFLKLRDLDLQRNDLEGTIPSQLFNARNLESLYLRENRLRGTIPETIGNLHKLRWLDISDNNLSGSIPDTMYSLANLKDLDLDNNKLSSSISTLIGNMNKLEWLSLSNNMLTGQVPFAIGNLSSLDELYLSNNTLSGQIPSSMFDLPLREVKLQYNELKGSISDDFCIDNEIWADCRNDFFQPEVNCSCCTCINETPRKIGACVDSYVSIIFDIDYDNNQYWKLEWSLKKNATGEEVLYDGPYQWFQIIPSTYETCVAYSDCFSINVISPPWKDIDYFIYWNNKSIHNGTIQGYSWNDDINEDDPMQTILSFQYDYENQQIATCHDIEYVCGGGGEGERITLKPNTEMRTIFNEVTKISGRSIIQDPSSAQSKALCWMLRNDPYHGTTTDLLDAEIFQRYILTILHMISPNGLFGDDVYPPDTHECDWSGITCRDNNKKIVTEISSSVINNKIINGTLMDEIGSLRYLEVLDLNQMELHGTIPRSFSNLWSLSKLNLSNNKLIGEMPPTLYQQLTKLEHIDLSNNLLTGSINDDIASYSRIHTLFLGKNSLTGSFPLERFKYNDLVHLDIGENRLNEIDFSLLLKHTELKTLVISTNFFVGNLPENIFTSLPELQYFNLSQNGFSGTIPSTLPEQSNITLFDAQANRFKGVIPVGMTNLHNVRHLNLQGNQLTGSLPPELNQLQNLEILILSHNELKGSIPFDPATLRNMDKLHLHNNKLSGEAPQFPNMSSYISDCGFPSDSLEPVSCSTCNTCCNSDGSCQFKNSEKFSQVQLTLIFMSTIIGIIMICYGLKNIITSNKYLESFFQKRVNSWNALTMINVKSIYHFFLMKNKIGWYVAFGCGVFQTATLFLFVHSADMVNEISDREYTMTCPSNSLECENSNTVSPYGKFIFFLILTIWLLRDIIGSVKLMLISFQKRNVDFSFTAGFVFSVTMLSLWTSIIYIDAIAAKNTDMIKDAVVLLFIIEIDERLLQLVETFNPKWVEMIDMNMSNSVVYTGENLIISSGLRRSSVTFNAIKKKINQRNDASPQPCVNDEESEESEKKDALSEDEDDSLNL